MTVVDNVVNQVLEYVVVDHPTAFLYGYVGFLAVLVASCIIVLIIECKKFNKIQAEREADPEYPEFLRLRKKFTGS